MAKKNIRTISKLIEMQLRNITGNQVVAACYRIYNTDRIRAGDLKHLGISMIGEKLHINNHSFIPLEASGSYSYRNINGYEIIRKDLHKETHYNSVEAPNWGDSYNGTHTVDLPYEKYPRDCYAPQLSQIRIDVKDSKQGLSQYLLTFEVNRVLDRTSKTFKNDLLTCLNLLQENIWTCGVKKAGATIKDYLQDIKVAWEILPPGSRDEVMTRLFGSRQPSDQEKEVAGDRYDFFMKLNPQKLIYGTSGLQRYFGALINKVLVVFENIEYGNAIYIMFKDWKELSRKSRTELLSGRYGREFQRIPHIVGWKKSVRGIIKNRLNC